MIKSAHIHYFQGIEDVIIDFSDGLNVILGPSHKGKSTVVRALKWVLQNEPRGYGFFSHFRPPKEITFVSVFFTEGIRITRKRSGADSGSYEIERPGQEVKILKALNTGVPDEIMQITRMNEINLRSQDDGRFLLDESPGARAKYLNKLVGLEIIDNTLKKINSEVTLQTSRLGVLNEDISDVETSLKKYENIEKIKTLVDSIESDHAEVLKLDADQQTILGLCDSIEASKKEVDNLSEWLEVEDEIEAVEQKLILLGEVSKECRSLDKIITSLEMDNVNILKSDEVLKVAGNVEEIDDLLKEYSKAVAEEKLISKVISGIEKEKANIEKAEASIKETMELLSEEDVCPTCGQTVEEWKI